MTGQTRLLTISEGFLPSSMRRTRHLSRNQVPQFQLGYNIPLHSLLCLSSPGSRRPVADGVGFSLPEDVVGPVRDLVPSHGSPLSRSVEVSHRILLFRDDRRVLKYFSWGNPLGAGDDLRVG